MKTAVITGGAGGIGRAVAQRFLSVGVSVALVDVGKADLDAAARLLKPVGGAKVVPYAVDVRDAKQVSGCVASVFSDLEDVTYLVNAAGISTSNLIVDVSEEEWDRVFAINTRGVFLLCKHVAAGMIRNKINGGRIVNFSSQAAKIGELGNGAYLLPRPRFLPSPRCLGSSWPPTGYL